MNNPHEQLKTALMQYERPLIAFSGGVDSSLLLYVAHEVYGANAVAATAYADFQDPNDLERAKDFCSRYGILHIPLQLDMATIPHFSKNPADRCYFCKKEIFSALIKAADSYGCTCVMDGSNVDDQTDYRPGRKALHELQIVSPLLEAGLNKSTVRELSKKLGLPTWEIPSNPCLATRIPYGEEITGEKLDQIGEAEAFLHKQGFAECRVRHHGALARIEIPPLQHEKLLTMKTELVTFLQSIGFTYCTLDLKGLRSGSMNEVLNES